MSGEPPVDIAWIDLVFAAAMVMVAVALSAWQRLGLGKSLAVRYQLVVVFMLTAATAVTAAGVVLWYRRTFFTSAAQLLPRVPV
jgi:ABC-type iron transport system FetAB permease component